MADTAGQIGQLAAAAVTGGRAAGYRLAGATLAIEVESSDNRRWLDEMLPPWFAAVPAAHAAVRVRMVEDGDRHGALWAEQWRAPTRPVACFSLDSALVSYPGWIEPDGTQVVADGEYGCLYRVRGDDVEVVVRPGDRLGRVGLLRVVLELSTLQALASPALIDLHAAAFAVEGVAVLLVGGRRAGKTSLLAHVLSSGQAALIAHDRLLVDCGSSWVAGVPTVVAVREGTEKRFPALGRGLPRRATLFHGGELDLPEARVAAAGDRLVVSSRQFAAQLGASVMAGAPLGAVIFPEICPDEAVWSLHPVGPSDGAARLLSGLYASRAEPRVPTVFQRVGVPVTTAEAQVALARQLAASARMVCCRLGRDAYRGHPRAWLHALPLTKAKR